MAGIHLSQLEKLLRQHFINTFFVEPDSTSSAVTNEAADAQREILASPDDLFRTSMTVGTPHASAQAAAAKILTFLMKNGIPKDRREIEKHAIELSEMYSSIAVSGDGDIKVSVVVT